MDNVQKKEEIRFFMASLSIMCIVYSKVNFGIKFSVLQCFLLLSDMTDFLFRMQDAWQAR